MTVPVAWLLQFGVAVLVAAVAYFLKRAADALEKVDARGQEHHTSIQLIQQEQKVQNARIAENTKDIDRGFLRQIASSGTSEDL